jgi:chemotaxis protein CheD
MQSIINPGVPDKTNYWATFDAGQPAADAGGARSVQVGIGQLKIGAHTGQLKTLLGSCIGIALLWKKAGRCGLAHCLLPEAPEAQREMGARYVSQAVPSLLCMIGATEADYPDIQVVLAGGATMFNVSSPQLRIGEQNIEAAKKHLRKRGLNVGYSRLGGNCGRTLTVDCATGSFTVNDIVTT